MTETSQKFFETNFKTFHTSIGVKVLAEIFQFILNQSLNLCYFSLFMIIIAKLNFGQQLILLFLIKTVTTCLT